MDIIERDDPPLDAKLATPVFWGKVAGFNVEELKADKFDACLKLIKNYLIPEEAMCVALDMKSDPEGCASLLANARDCMRDGTSVVVFKGEDYVEPEEEGGEEEEGEGEEETLEEGVEGQGRGEGTEDEVKAVGMTVGEGDGEQRGEVGSENGSAAAANAREGGNIVENASPCAKEEEETGDTTDKTFHKTGDDEAEKERERRRRKRRERREKREKREEALEKGEEEDKEDNGGEQEQGSQDAPTEEELRKLRKEKRRRRRKKRERERRRREAKEKSKTREQEKEGLEEAETGEEAVEEVGDDEEDEDESVVAVMVGRVVQRTEYMRSFSRIKVVQGDAYPKWLALRCHLQKAANLFDEFDIDTYYRLYHIVVHPDHRKKGVGSFLARLAATRLADLFAGAAGQDRGQGTICTAVAPSRSTQRLLAREGFRPQVVLNYHDWKDDQGQQVIKNAGVGNYNVVLATYKVPAREEGQPLDLSPLVDHADVEEEPPAPLTAFPGREQGLDKPPTPTDCPPADERPPFVVPVYMSVPRPPSVRRSVLGVLTPQQGGSQRDSRGSSTSGTTSSGGSGPSARGGRSSGGSTRQSTGAGAA